jgi:hypothetical protein
METITYSRSAKVVEGVSIGETRGREKTRARVRLYGWENKQRGDVEALKVEGFILYKI